MVVGQVHCTVNYCRDAVLPEQLEVTGSLVVPHVDVASLWRPEDDVQRVVPPSQPPRTRARLVGRVDAQPGPEVPRLLVVVWDREGGAVAGTDHQPAAVTHCEAENTGPVEKGVLSENDSITIGRQAAVQIPLSIRWRSRDGDI